jgi:alpha-ketoglutarate-dependent taurine dioxygenase
MLSHLTRASRRRLSHTRCAASLASCVQEGSSIRVEWADGCTGRFSFPWLRDHDPKDCDPITHQRNFETATMDLNIRPAAVVVDRLGEAPEQISIQWEKEDPSVFASDWLRGCCGAEEQPVGLNLWDSAYKHTPTQFADAMESETALHEALTTLHRDGVVFVHGTPGDIDAVEAFAERIGFVMETMYGRMWSTGADDTTVQNPSTSDSAYSNIGLGLHTDCTYLHNPPGLQLFNCVVQSADGGSSLFLDAFKAAQVLREDFKESFDFLTSTPIKFQCVDGDTHAVAWGPILKLDYTGAVCQIRHNDYDRAPLDHLTFKQVEQFYSAHRDWTSILRRQDLLLDVRLEQGTMAVLNNGRVMHGRRAFQGRRILNGCYVGLDEFESRLRRSGIIR